MLPVLLSLVLAADPGVTVEPATTRCPHNGPYVKDPKDCSPLPPCVCWVRRPQPRPGDPWYGGELLSGFGPCRPVTAEEAKDCPDVPRA